MLFDISAMLGILLNRLIDQFAKMIRQSFVAAIVAEGQPAMIEAKEMENGGVDIVDAVGLLTRHSG
jgi:hypothetical protein